MGQPPAFDVVVLGCGGGPCETNLSAYLVKPHETSWKDGLLALEAGSGIGALRELLKRDPHIFDEPNTTYDDGLPTAQDIYSAIRCFLVTHAHFDHIAGLVLSAGSLNIGSSRRRVRGLPSVLDDVASVFSGRVWPDLASYDPGDDPYKLLLDPLPANTDYHALIPSLEARAMPLAHGPAPSTSKAASTSCHPYDSSAFFVRHIPSSAEFIFLGDVEPDSVSHTSRNRALWRAAAQRGIPRTVRALFVECSWPAGRPDSLLFGHLSPEYVAAELRALAWEVRLAAGDDRGGVVRSIKGKHRTEGPANGARKSKRRRGSIHVMDCDTLQSNGVASVGSEDPLALVGALTGLTVYIIHCKDDFSPAPGDTPVNERIVEQVKALVHEDGLGCEIVLARQGMRFTI